MIDDESGDTSHQQRQYLDDLLVDTQSLGQCELWKSLLGRPASCATPWSAPTALVHIDEAAGIKQPPPLVADAIDKAKTDLMLRVNDALKALDQRMTALEKKADEEERQTKAAAALTLAEDIAENAPKALLSSLADRERNQEVPLMPSNMSARRIRQGEDPSPSRCHTLMRIAVASITPLP